MYDYGYNSNDSFNDNHEFIINLVTKLWVINALIHAIKQILKIL